MDPLIKYTILLYIFRCRSIQLGTPQFPSSIPLLSLKTSIQELVPFYFDWSCIGPRDMTKFLVDVLLSGASGLRDFETLSFEGFSFIAHYFPCMLNWWSLEQAFLRSFGASLLQSFGTSEIWASEVPPNPHNVPSERWIRKLPERDFIASLLRFSRASDFRGFYTFTPYFSQTLNFWIFKLVLWHFITLSLHWFGFESVDYTTRKISQKLNMCTTSLLPSSRVLVSEDIATIYTYTSKCQILLTSRVSSTTMHQGGATWQK